LALQTRIFENFDAVQTVGDVAPTTDGSTDTQQEASLALVAQPVQPEAPARVAYQKSIENFSIGVCGIH
jgi:hypothetical protein